MDGVSMSGLRSHRPSFAGVEERERERERERDRVDRSKDAYELDYANGSSVGRTRGISVSIAQPPSGRLSIRDLNFKRNLKQLFKQMLDPAVYSSLLWLSCSISMVLTNKMILTTFDFNYNILLLLYQNTICVIVMMFAKLIGFISYEPLTMENVYKWMPLDFFFVIMICTGTFSLKYLSVPMVTIFKNSNNILITLLDYLIYGNKTSTGVAIVMVIMLLAAVLATIEDLEFSLTGYVWTFMHCLGTTAFIIYMPRAMSSTKLSRLGEIYYNNLLSLPLLVFVDMIYFKNLRDIYLEGIVAWPFLLHILLGLSGLLAFGLNATAFECMNHTSPTIYSLLGSFSKIPLTIISVYLFDTNISFSGGIYIGLALVASIVFGYTKTREGQSGFNFKPLDVEHYDHFEGIEEGDEEEMLLTEAEMNYYEKAQTQRVRRRSAEALGADKV